MFLKSIGKRLLYLFLLKHLVYNACLLTPKETFAKCHFIGINALSYPMCSHILCILFTLTDKEVGEILCLHSSTVREGRSYGQNNLVGTGRKFYFCLCCRCCLWMWIYLPWSWLSFPFHGYFLFFFYVIFSSAFLILFLCEQTSSELLTPLPS